ncbi:vasorin-like [Zophobas morio]
MPSLLLNLVVRICLFNVSNSDKITFENVTVRSYFYKGALETQATSVNLKKMIPDEEPVRVDITGGVPILYEKSVFDIPNLNSLDLADVGLEEIKPGAFGNLPLLDTLFLNRNNLTLIKSGTFTDLNVSYLDLSSNSIFLLQPRAFKNFKAGHVSLDKNKLTEISSGVFENVTLRSLSLGDNHLYIIAPKALSAIGLTTLSLFGNKLEEIDPEVFDMQELVSLDLDDNSIKLLRPGDLRNLPELEAFSLEKNGLKEIPDGIFNNTKLTYLNLATNQIVKIASKAFDDMLALRVLKIDSNNLTQWDDWLTSPFASISVRFNQITEIPDEAFKNYFRLFNINLQGNRIRKISTKAFRKLEQIRYFNLADNEIDNWDPDTLGNVSIVSLDLSENRLKCIKGDLETIFKNVQKIRLENNPWKKECAKKVEKFQKKKKQIP